MLRYNTEGPHRAARLCFQRAKGGLLNAVVVTAEETNTGAICVAEPLTYA
jgi:hypothetical protein